MENYTKARTAEQPSVCPFPDLAPNTPEVRVKDGSKIRNLLRFALSRMETNALADEQTGQTTQGDGVSSERHEDTAAAAASCQLCKQIVFTASGKGVSKAITCAEVVKRRVKGLHQLTKLLYSTAVEVWEPLEPDAGLDSLTVNRNLPSIWILLSTAPLDSSQHGYQAPGRYEDLWAQTLSREDGGGVTSHKAGQKRKRGGGGGGGGGGRGRGKGPGRGRAKDAAR
ncbi:ribonuclease P protein subunit p25-like protein [Cynoglossus semilaevis]|uniref:ribonuclease P protein subunit p25-like protein n=1 Tax=Cynoglossus semilaevis TaxID=244447 RepID=UPI000496C9FC|nr:ribonuclease P protein subunit p25-like protein [Cynoglossus semilaevis]XP_024917696.1 ribonuclease P protein subunit p25-like protein [Cynoglossus semilaevis]